MKAADVAKALASSPRASIADLVAMNTPWDDTVFRHMVFGGEALPSVVSDAMVYVLREGFTNGDGNVSFAALCFRHGRLEIFKEVLAARRPDVVAGRNLSSQVDWLQLLCTRMFAGRHAHTPMVSFATFDISPHSVDFVALALKIDPSDPNVHAAEFGGGEAAAVVNAARMQNRIKAELGSKAARLPGAALAPRRMRPI